MVTVLPLRSDTSPATLEEVVRVLRNSGLVAVPTETFYALGALALDPIAVRRVGHVKGRSDGKPILVLIADRAQLADVATEVPHAASILMARYWPGPLTLVLPASPHLPFELTGGTGTVGVRQPGCAELRRLLSQTGPLTGTSANKTGAPPARSAEEVQASLGAEIDLILDGGVTPGGLPSTLVDATGPIRLLREGPISWQQIADSLAQAGINPGS